MTPHPMHPSLLLNLDGFSKVQKERGLHSSRMDVVREMNSEGTKAICKLCKRIAKDSSFIPENLKLTFLVSGSFPIAIYTIFYKLISSAIMNNIKEHLPGIFFSCPVLCLHPRRRRRYHT